MFRNMLTVSHGARLVEYTSVCRMISMHLHHLVRMVIVDCTPEDPAPLDPTPRADAKVTKQGAGKKAEGQHMEDSDASTSSAADEKAKLHAQAKRLELWLEENGKNLYPSRPQKERLAKELGMTLLQVTRWFSNRRRKQHKRPKTTASAEDRSKHIQDIVDEVVQRTANGEALQLSSRSMNIDVDEFDESDASDASKENEEHQKDMQETLNDIWIKALKNGRSFCSCSFRGETACFFGKEGLLLDPSRP
uniref:Homeobox domain-containing protein n=1 Tax=Steinernema glaseri TaxID=37863 RepID=A0A1I8AJR3_9BILA